MAGDVGRENGQDEDEGCVVGARQVVADQSADTVALWQVAKAKGAGYIGEEKEDRHIAAVVCRETVVYPDAE